MFSSDLSPLHSKAYYAYLAHQLLGDVLIPRWDRKTNLIGVNAWGDGLEKGSCIRRGGGVGRDEQDQQDERGGRDERRDKVDKMEKCGRGGRKILATDPWPPNQVPLVQTRMHHKRGV